MHLRYRYSVGGLWPGCKDGRGSGPSMDWVGLGQVGSQISVIKWTGLVARNVGWVGLGPENPCSSRDVALNMA